MFNMLYNSLPLDLVKVIIWDYIDPVPLEKVKENHTRVMHELKRYWIHREIRMKLKRI
jgi:hypothetical protein